MKLHRLTMMTKLDQSSTGNCGKYLQGVVCVLNIRVTMSEGVQTKVVH